MRDVVAKARLLIDAQHAGDAAGDCADSAADNRADRASVSIAFIRPFSGAADNALGAGGERQGQQNKSGRGEKFHIHVNLQSVMFHALVIDLTASALNKSSGAGQERYFSCGPSKSMSDTGSTDFWRLTDDAGRAQHRKLLNPPRSQQIEVYPPFTAGRTHHAPITNWLFARRSWGLAIYRTVRSIGGWIGLGFFSSRCGQRALDGAGEVVFEIRFLYHRGGRPERANPRRVTADEDLRDHPAAQDAIDSANSASFAQLYVHDHHARPELQGRDHRIGLGGRDGADAMTLRFEHFGQNGGDHGVVFDHQDAERFHLCASPPAPPWLTLAAICRAFCVRRIIAAAA
jgi:hypothetical protein